ncbi:MAG: PhoH family protein [Clostridia bacterium]|nr:PhoH family protein [Clostridia bacterium]
MQDQIALYGMHDSNIKYIKKKYNINVKLIDQHLQLSGEDSDVEKAKCVIEVLLQKAKSQNINKYFIDLVMELVEQDELDSLADLTQVISINAKGKPISAKTIGQAKYVNAIKKKSIVFGVGPAGTGKTYLAVALAALAFKNKQIDKIILTRPAVEAGEKLGFLPGDLGAKVDPYLRPLYDALQEMFGLDTYAKLLERGAIEIAPLAYMRGRTLSNAFIILDEAQNTTKEQMKMFLTRMGEGSKIVVTGDVTQIDLPNKEVSGLIHATKILNNIDDIAIIKLSSKDVVRSELVQAIVDAYAESEEKGKV